mmetsp:Transcript_23150/g.42617  ORF Transcript_23150/g.42617 Transcript_23150/m.42617 type:complete len:121 (-) Transcript_23150:3-365(-)
MEDWEHFRTLSPEMVQQVIPQLVSSATAWKAAPELLEQLRVNMLSMAESASESVYELARRGVTSMLEADQGEFKTHEVLSALTQRLQSVAVTTAALVQTHVARSPRRKLSRREDSRVALA